MGGLELTAGGGANVEFEAIGKHLNQRLRLPDLLRCFFGWRIRDAARRAGTSRRSRLVEDSTTGVSQAVAVVRNRAASESSGLGS
jgi:hypothetical protein